MSFARAGVALVTVKSTLPALIASSTSASRANSTCSYGTPRRSASARPRSTLTPRASPRALRTSDVGLPGYTPTRSLPEGASA